MLKLQGLDHIVLRVRDIVTTLAWYEKLGCKLVKSNDKAGIYHLYCGGGTLIDLIPIDGPCGQQGGAPPTVKGGHNMDHICLKVEPFDEGEIRAHLKEKMGIEAEECVIRYGADGDGPSMYVKDPEGNGVELKGRIWPIDDPRPAGA